MSNQPKLVPQPEASSDLEPALEIAPVDLEPAPEIEPVSIAKPAAFDLNRFKSRRGAEMANVGTLLAALPVCRISEIKDFVRLHPDEDEYWSDELCFANVPVKGQKHDTLHLVDEDLAMRYLPAALVKRFRLALATRPNDVFFLCQVPSQNIDNTWVCTNLMACDYAKERWTVCTSCRDEGVEGYKAGFALDEDAFAKPDWPTQSLSELIGVTFAGRMIDRVDHPAMIRLRGGKQSMK